MKEEDKLHDDKDEERQEELPTSSEQDASEPVTASEASQDDAIPPVPDAEEGEAVEDSGDATGELVDQEGDPGESDVPATDEADVSGSESETVEVASEEDSASQGDASEDEVTPEEAAEMDQAAVEFLEARMESMKAELDATKAELARSEALLAKKEESQARLQADFDNYRRRQLRDNERVQDERVEKLLLKVLPVYDTFGRAIDQYDKDNSEEALYDGLQRIEKMFQQLLEQMGITQIEAKGKPFDPNLHEALCRVEVPEDGFDEMVVDVFETGYIYNERVIKPSRVSVGKE
jgi:molecular chaperone GrpE